MEISTSGIKLFESSERLEKYYNFCMLFDIDLMMVGHSTIGLIFVGKKQ